MNKKPITLDDVFYYSKVLILKLTPIFYVVMGGFLIAFVIERITNYFDKLVIAWWPELHYDLNDDYQSWMCEQCY